MRDSLQLKLDRLAGDRWARRGVRLLLRASTLALSVVCIAVGVQLLSGVAIRWTLVGALALACIAGGAVLVLRPRLSARDVARRLDRRFRLDEQLSTALEIGPNAEGVGAYLHDQARRSFAQVRRQIAARQGFPWAELLLVAALVLLLAGLLALAGIGRGPLAGSAEPLPPLAEPVDPAEQFPEEPFQPPPGSQPGDQPGGQGGAGAGEGVPAPGDSAAVQALADALRDQSVTRPAAEALDQGDTAGAAQSLRELADQAEGLSEQARQDLADALRDAANQLEPSAPELADQARDSADAIEQGGQEAAQGLDDLANAVEQLGQGAPQQPAPGQGQGEQGQGSGGAGQGSLPGEQREGDASDRLGVDGVPLELEAEGSGDTPTQGSSDTPTSSGGTGGSGGFSSGAPSSERVEIGDDPLRIPADLRDVVQDYFSP